ncbi:AAA family ATPase [Streptomyces sp. NPDC000961]|uniref:AAA family ATPase n=1 Tax=Streptomyces sp. NPDC000961 TaxID=3364541 RepID=UPI0036B7A05B
MGTEEEKELAALVRTWLDDRGVSVDSVLSCFTADHFSGQSPPSRTTTYSRLSGKGITWEFVEAVADVITETAADHQTLLRAARPLWERVLEGIERQNANKSPDITETMREMLDLAQELREAQQHLTGLRSENRDIAWTLIVTCQEICRHLASLNVQSAHDSVYEINAAPHQRHLPASTSLSDPGTIRRLEDWALRITRLAQVLARPESSAMATYNNGVGLYEAIESSLRELEAGLRHSSRQLNTPLPLPSLNLAAEPDPGYRGGGFLRSARLNLDLLSTKPLLSDGMPDGLANRVADRLVEIPMVRIACQGITVAPGITVLAGPNGSGKSLILEALSHSLLEGMIRHSSASRPLSRWLADALEISFHHRPRPQDVWYSSYLSLTAKGDPRLSAVESFRAALNMLPRRPGLLYLLDEPEAGLTPQLTEELVSWMDDRVRVGCQFIIATHSMTIASLDHARVIMASR